MEEWRQYSRSCLSHVQMPKVWSRTQACHLKRPAPISEAMFRHFRKYPFDATKHDSINMWLLNNLQASSEEKQRHRAFLANSEDLNEEQRLDQCWNTGCWTKPQRVSKTDLSRGTELSTVLDCVIPQGYTSMIGKKSLEIMLRASNFLVKLNHSD